MSWRRLEVLQVRLQLIGSKGLAGAVTITEENPRTVEAVKGPEGLAVAVFWTPPCRDPMKPSSCQENHQELPNLILLVWGENPNQKGPPPPFPTSAG